MQIDLKLFVQTKENVSEADLRREIIKALTSEEKIDVVKLIVAGRMGTTRWTNKEKILS